MTTVPLYLDQVFLPPGSDFNLKVQVNDAVTHQCLSRTVVEVYINYTRTSTALTGEDGDVLLHVPYQAGLPVVVVASRDGYMCSLLPCNTGKTLIFSSVTIPLLGLNQGNIWLFDDSVLITGKTSDVTAQPVIQFPKSLLNLTDSSNVTSVKAYLTIPKLSEDHSFLNTLGIMSSKTGYVSVELNPVAAVHVQLFSGDTELHVSGSVQISLSITDSSALQSSNVVPAWLFNQTTGGWMRKGLGKVVSVDGKLIWTFTAPQLGYWMAAPLSSGRGFFELAIPIDFIAHHSSFLTVLLGGMLVIVICLLAGSLYSCRRSISGTKKKRILPVMTKDQTTSTCDDEVCEVSSGDICPPQNGLTQSFIDNQNKTSVISVQNGNARANPSAVAITMQCNDPHLNTELNDLTCSYKPTEQMRVPATVTENIFFYNQPAAILHMPAFFQVEEQPEPRKCATLPHAGASNSSATEPQNKDGFTQTLSKGSSLSQNQAVETEDQLGFLEASQAAAATNTWGHFSLPESVSVPGTLNKMRGSRHSVHALAELCKISSPQLPRAWFVSLDGKPAAEIHYAVSEEQRRRRPVESRETSLDSGVDMSELNQSSGRRAVTLERNATFVRSTSSSKHAPPQ